MLGVGPSRTRYKLKMTLLQQRKEVEEEVLVEQPELQWRASQRGPQTSRSIEVAHVRAR